MARAALDAQEFAIARRALAPLSIAPSQRVAMLMAELEEKEHGDEGRAREWMTRAVRARPDPAWTADGFVSDRWMPVSPVTGRLDAFQWKDPIAELDADEAVIEHEARAAAAPVSAAASAAAADVRDQAAGAEAGRSRAGRVAARAGRDAGLRGQPPRRRRAPVVPLVHVPDDPGPEPQPQLEPETEIAEPSGDSWRKLRGLFK